ncbi:GPN-loop GTPase 3-like isoform X1 [Cynara cardunculus var. scolymus]|uniref:GPN-loop GTPase 3-like isoform X1 n=1 Tax=Cynara cardunculus var. scolymus TaxID=59895 RepID=UPI000D625A72|nr:GPN-loop GTPase 3-like isoform X1 [Cynara cardunculus var. scolymus]XP_024967420.1 GPN-loop GTPase 3-like isoform X1 [Cynara cardunculus var. scolymus]
MGCTHLVSGKTTYRTSLYQHFEAARQTIHTVKSDSASKKINHPVMEELGLGPNGDLMQHLEEKVKTEELEYYIEDHCLVFDRNGVKMD